MKYGQANHFELPSVVLKNCHLLLTGAYEGDSNSGTRNGNQLNHQLFPNLKKFEKDTST